MKQSASNARQRRETSGGGVMESTLSSRTKRRSVSQQVKPTPDSLRNTMCRTNNSWYSDVESGEAKELIRKGTFPAIEQLQPRKALVDQYTKSRYRNNPALRDSYVNDCSDTIHRDWSVRFREGYVNEKNKATQFPPLGFGRHTNPNKDPRRYFETAASAVGVSSQSPEKGVNSRQTVKVGPVGSGHVAVDADRFYGIPGTGVHRAVHMRDHIVGYQGFVGRVDKTVGKETIACGSSP